MGKDETATGGIQVLRPGSADAFLTCVKPRPDAVEEGAQIDADAITVMVRDGQVTLNGRGRAWHERQIAERAAWSAPGVKAVDDRLAISGH
ncbi:BON domain-containing protein [Azospirillum agricola]|uniref:BON domain-containing protein n=1 Tax=Azospirillum agricola TaxID=1720247 RepID=UPI000A1CE2F5|nr:BON domain-containing protein [Azospirillum agricola]